MRIIMRRSKILIAQLQIDLMAYDFGIVAIDQFEKFQVKAPNRSEWQRDKEGKRSLTSV